MELVYFGAIVIGFIIVKDIIISAIMANKMGPLAKRGDINRALGANLDAIIQKLDDLKMPDEVMQTLKDLGVVLPLLPIDQLKLAKKLYVAAQMNDVDTIKRLRDMGVFTDPNMLMDGIPNLPKGTTIGTVAANVWAESILVLLKEMGADFSIENNDGLSVMSFTMNKAIKAATDKNIAELDRLKRIGLLYDVNLVDLVDISKRTIGHVALDIKSVELFTWFLHNGGRRDISDGEGRTVDSILNSDAEVKMKTAAIENDKALEEAKAAENQKQAIEQQKRQADKVT